MCVHACERVQEGQPAILDYFFWGGGGGGGGSSHLLNYHFLTEFTSQEAVNIDLMETLSPFTHSVQY